jgi:dipeptidyl aminopeptidase/acylaminoacyl peptidase/predicted Ser/Thr protein kinase
MRLEPGVRIGPYEVLSLIGSGGMGKVYKARDTRLGRTVAIKVLHTPSIDLRQRFDREARVVAALQHPHICTLIDVGNHAGADYIVMEFLDGKPLSRPQPLAKVVEYGVQIADAVDAVHRRGVIHRDLKPDNILVTSHGIKILDFGIAKTSNPQETATQPGLAIGTPAYMAPEQWKGSADHRTDIYALGCVLYEMAAGELPSEKPLQPARLEWIVRGCLAPEPDDRWQSARDVGRLLKTVTEPDVASVPALRRGWFWPVMATLAGLAGALAIWMLTPTPSRDLLQVSLAPPREANFLVGRNREGGFAVSPDGTMLAFTAPVEGRTYLWIRRFDSLDARMMPGTDGAYTPFWSPDSKSLGFYTPEKLMTIDAAGGEPKTICRTDPRSTGGSWGSDDVLLVTGVSGGINRIPANGGTLVPIAAGYWPHFLPDGKRFLFQRDNAVWVGSVEASEQPRQLLEGPALKPTYSLDHVLFMRDRTLMAHRVAAAVLTLSGTAFPVAESVTSSTLDTIGNPGEFSASRDGRLVYAAGGNLNKLVWRDRAGNVLSELASGAEFGTPRISPDGKHVAFAQVDRDNMDIYSLDQNRPPAVRLTSDSRLDRYPIWSPDSTSITFSSGELRQADLYRMPADGSRTPERLTHLPSPQHAMDWSSDGKYLSFTRNVKGTDLMILPAGGQEYIFLQTNVSEAHSQFNPGPPRWLAYSSDEVDGRREIFVHAFVPGQRAGGQRRQISKNGGTMPRWRRDGKEIYYWALDGRIMAVEVNGDGPVFQSSAPRELFKIHAPTLRTNDISFDVTPDGLRFLVVEPVERVQTQPLTFVTDWLASAKR